MQRTFCAAFSLLGLKLLFGSDRALSLGSVFLTACVSMALAFMLEGSGGEETMGVAMAWAGAAVNATCDKVTYGGPFDLACHMLGRARGPP